MSVWGRPAIDDDGNVPIIGLHKSVSVSDFELTDLALALASSIVDRSNAEPPSTDEDKVGAHESCK